MYVVRMLCYDVCACCVCVVCMCVCVCMCVVCVLCVCVLCVCTCVINVHTCTCTYLFSPCLPLLLSPSPSTPHLQHLTPHLHHAHGLEEHLAPVELYGQVHYYSTDPHMHRWGGRGPAHQRLKAHTHTHKMYVHTCTIKINAYRIAGNFRGIIFSWIGLFALFRGKKFRGCNKRRPHPLVEDHTH